jgi:hypothetical protein
MLSGSWRCRSGLPMCALPKKCLDQVRDVHVMILYGRSVMDQEPEEKQWKMDILVAQ